MSKRFNINQELEKLFIEVSKPLLYETKYKPNKETGSKGLSNDAKLLYGILLDRTKLSIHKATQEGDIRFIDENGDIFIYFVNQAIAEILNFGEKKAIAVKKELVEYGLLEEVQQGDKKANRLYLNIVETDKSNLKKYTSNFQETVNNRKKVEKERIQSLRTKQKNNLETVENTMNCSLDSTRTVQQTVRVLSERQSSNTKEFSNTDFSNTEFNKSVVVYINGKKIEIKDEFRKIQLNPNKTIDEKMKLLEELTYMSESTKALVYKFLKYNILITEPQTRMLNEYVYDVAVKALDETISQNGECFSYFRKIYVSEEEKDIANTVNDFVFIPKFESGFNWEV